MKLPVLMASKKKGICLKLQKLPTELLHGANYNMVLVMVEDFL